jgi:hypothetical protein
MSNGPRAQSSSVPSALEFQDVDLPEARKSLEELPAGVNERQRVDPDYWQQRRRKPVPTDRALTGAAIDWLLALPQELRSKTLCEHFPRIANRLAEIWHDRAQAVRELELLRADDRPRRKGFPAEVRFEILRLSQYMTQLAAGSPDDAK